MHTVFRFLRQLLLTVLLLALLALVAAGGYFAVTGHKLYESAIQVTPIDTLYQQHFVPRRVRSPMPSCPRPTSTP